MVAAGYVQLKGGWGTGCYFIDVYAQPIHSKQKQILSTCSSLKWEGYGLHKHPATCGITKQNLQQSLLQVELNIFSLLSPIQRVLWSLCMPETEGLRGAFRIVQEQKEVEEN